MTTSLSHRLALGLALLPACTVQINTLTVAQNDDDSSEPPAGDDTTGGAGTTGVDDTTGDTTGGTTGGIQEGPSPGARDVDILFVVDNSGSMALAQQRLAAGVGPMVEALELADVDYRIAVTTTDSGNPRCSQAVTKPEQGHMVATSCRARALEGEFVFGFDEHDYSAACLAVCEHEQLEILGTATHADATLAPRPWLERIGAATNVDVPLAEAAACVLPQGVAGCGFEQPLESMHNALARAQTPGEPEYGFLRPHANLLIVLVTDETDCSYSALGGKIFTTNKEFWSDEDDAAPTSAVCWRAGMRCVGGPDTFDSCEPATFDLDAELTQDEAAGVLQPLSRYRASLAAIAGEKAQAGDGRVYLAAIGGVPGGYQLGDALVYTDGADLEFQTDFGIDPGCVSGEGDTLQRAVPPGRLLPVVTSTPGAIPLGEGLYSICDGLEGHAGALGELLVQ